MKAFVHFLILTLLISGSGPAFADRPNFEQEEAEIPKIPSAPPSLQRKAYKMYFHCQRYFIHAGKKYECDSNLGKDAEGLRPILNDVPEALAELDAYQRARKNLNTAAYVGSAGLISMIAGAIISRPPFDPQTGTIRPGGYFLVGGLALAVGALTYGIIGSIRIEDHLKNAIQIYNQKLPNQSIDFQLAPTFHF